MALPSDFEAQADNAEHLRDSVESAWDEGQALADEIQVSRDVVALEIERRDSSDREVAEASYDAGMWHRERRQREVEAATGNRIEETADPADQHEIRKALAEGYDAADKPAETKAAEPEKPQAETEQDTAPAADVQPGAEWTAEDRAVLDRMAPEARQWAETQAAAVRQTYGGVDALADKWGGYLAGLGASAPQQQVGMLDRLLATEHALRTGSPEQRAAILADLGRQYGAGAPAQASAPVYEAGPINPAHPLQAAALASSQAAPAQQAHNPNSLHGRLESEWQAQRQAEQANASREAQAAAHQHRMQEINGQIREFAEAKDEHGHPRHALIGAIIPEMIEAANMLRQAGHKPDLPTVYQAAVAYAKQTRPEIAEAGLADAKGRVRAFRYANPVAHDPQLEARMTSIAKADQRLTGTVDLKSVLDRALKLEPHIAGRQEAHDAKLKEHGLKPQPTLRQELEAAWSAMAA